MDKGDKTLLLQPKSHNQKRFELIDHLTGKVIHSDTNYYTATKKMIAQHYKYLRCNKKALSVAFDISGGSKSKCFAWIIKHANHSKNVIHFSQRTLAKKMGVSIYTLYYVLKKLKKHNLAKTSTGVIAISPMLFFYGSDHKFLSELKKFDAM